MKIRAVEAIALRIPYDSGGSTDAAAWGGKTWNTADALLVKVTTDEGIIGWGEAFGYNAIPATKVAIEEMIAPLCIGRDPRNMEELNLELQKKLHIFGRGGPVIYGISGVDIALWDIAGKAAGLPIHALLGGSRVPKLACYASLIRYSDPEVVAANTERALGQGFRHIKLHEIDVAAIRAARQAAGDGIGIMLDVNCPWSVPEALEMAKQLRPLSLRWLEEPVWPPEDYAGLARVRTEGGIPVAAGENAASVLQYEHMLASNAVDYVQPSPIKMGGISELRKVFKLAPGRRVTVMPHTFYDGPGLLAGVHAIAALSQDPLVEWRFFDLEQRLFGDSGTPEEGLMAVPQGAGLGLDPDLDVIRRYEVR